LNLKIYIAILAFYSVFINFTLRAQVTKTFYLKQESADTQTDFYHLNDFGNTEKKSITFIAQDSLGQMWFATKDGLLRYDAKKLYSYKKEPNNPNSIGGLFVERIFIGKDGSVWVGTEPAVLSKYRPQTDDFITINGISGKRIKGIQQDKDGIYWITTNKTLYRYDDQIKSLKSFTYKEGNIGLDRLLITSKNRIFITTNETYILEFFPKTESFKEIKLIPQKISKKSRSTATYSVYYLVEDYKDFIWITTPYGFIYRYNPNTTDLQKYIYENLDNGKLDYGKITIMFITEDDTHNLWFGTWFNGLYKISKDRISIVNYLPQKNNPNSLTNTIIHSGFQDKAGYMWFGTEFSGINILKKNKKFSIIPHQSTNKLNSPSIIESITLDNNNQVWIASEQQGLFVFDKDHTREIKNVNKLLNFPKKTYVFSLLYDSKDYLWIGTNKGLYKYNPKTKTKIIYKRDEKDYNSLICTTVTSLAEDKKGNIWVGSTVGLTQFNTVENRFYRFSHEKKNPKSLSNTIIRSIYCDSHDNVWVGTKSGLNRFVPETGSFRIYKHNYRDTSSISADRINSITELNNKLWIGTQGGGLNQFDYETEKFISFQTKDGFPSDNIIGINNDNHDNLWLTSSNNIIKYNVKTKKHVVYGKSDGIEKSAFINEDIGFQQLEFSTNTFKDNNGFLYFGGIAGLTIFHPDSLPINNYIPPIKINSFSVNGKQKSIEKQLILNPDQNNIVLRITALNFIQPEKNKYAFFLENYDSIWKYTNNKNEISYYDLPRGKYLLHYKASNNDGVWNDNTTPIKITIKPYFYQSFLFKILLFVIFSILILAFFLHKYYIKRKIKQQREKLKYSTSSIDKKEVETIDLKLQKELKNSEIFLESDLTLHKLANSINVKPNYLSQVINQIYNKNFNEFINSYRLEYAKKLLIESVLKIEAVAYDSGFNSLSTFNRFFKNEVGITPSQYRNKYTK